MCEIDIVQNSIADIDSDTRQIEALLASLDEPFDPATYRPPVSVRPLAERLLTGDFGSNWTPAKPAATPENNSALRAAGDTPCAVGVCHPTPNHTSGSTPNHTSPSTHTHPSPSTSKRGAPASKPKRSRVLQAAVDDLNPYTKSWSGLWDHQRAAVSFDALTNHPEAYAFTLDLHENRDDFLLSRSDPADDLRRYASRELRKTFGRVLPFGFAFDVSQRTGRLHAHGIILIPASEDRPAVREALARADGRIKGRAGSRQVTLRPLSDGIGWAGYSLKAFDDVVGLLRTRKVTFCTNELKAIGRANHLEQKALADSQKAVGSSPAVRVRKPPKPPSGLL